MPRFEQEPPNLFDQRVMDILNGKLPVDRSTLTTRQPNSPLKQWGIQSHSIDPLTGARIKK